ncbi:tRNA (guanine-N2-)-methyltransferase catalytic subunit Trm11 [Schizosaccharomyces cryophilus OY26]|uniref:tRNA (guanine(10)-N(2))-methyltransferase n=1 Tax=Schizosaccharomyces cryophilus (strain OY26 / ATCC MYA-4695 / CBS 11777 / NBRC 106824 / NRRL Y48691) TaxID=653667 RepID=S9W5B0_SCHCR|nr:tRNA (guanine-N2-)-methyltransferase catalytic subunit Trm11 [Schizosaccharomyces cryophilus OY26]EPY53744.1 tRNA (guanine-N2-)-methyltransferase catalytic subunit Trm11 [Schizosaccharomyces cryophilus OY26]
MPIYLLHLASTHADFHIPELETLAKIECVHYRWIKPSCVRQSLDLQEPSVAHSQSEKPVYPINHTNATTLNPFLLVELEDDLSAARWIRRSIFCKGIYELYGFSETFDSLHDYLSKLPSPPWLAYQKKTSYKFTFETFGTRRTMEEQLSIINDFGYMGLEGLVSMKHPECIFTLLENRSKDIEGPKMYFGRWCGGSSRDAIDKFDLKRRNYIGITSFDAELSLITAQMAMAMPGKLVYDPFAGTGSFLYTCSYFGAFTMGSDIDGRQMRGKGRKSIRSNFTQYQLANSFVDVFTGDVTNCPLRQNFLVDAIVCDPPYGVRAGAKKIAKSSSGSSSPSQSTSDSTSTSHYPKLEQYQISDMVFDLICFAAMHLVDYGRLVLWLPTITEEYSIEDIPRHPCLSLIFNSVQPFTHWSRRLLTFERLPRSETNHVPSEVFEKSLKTPSHHDFRKKYFMGARRTASPFI